MEASQEVINTDRTMSLRFMIIWSLNLKNRLRKEISKNVTYFDHHYFNKQ